MGIAAVGAERVPGIRGTYLGKRQLADPAGAIGEALEAAVVEREQHAVAGEVDVRLQVPISHRDGRLESGQGVLRRLTAAPTMGEGDRGRSLEK